MPSIQRQTILSSIFIYIGFFIGAANLLLVPFVLNTHEFGLTKVVNDFCIVAAAFATFGSGSVISKFYPYYKAYIKDKENDLLFITVLVSVVGMALVLTAIYLAKPYIIIAFGRNDQEIFTRFYWTVFPYTVFYLIFLQTEPFFWISGKSVIYNLIKETGFRILTTGFLLLVLFEVIQFTGFMYLYSFLYLLPAVAAIVVLYRSRRFVWYPHISKVTRRMKTKMTSFAGFLFFTGLLTLLVRVCDTLFLAGQRSFGDAAIFTYALYFAQILDVPNRSITGSAVPVLAEYWRIKNMKGIASVYSKSTLNLMIAGLVLGGMIVINLDNAIRFFPAEYGSLRNPTIILVLSQLVNLATGLNAMIIHTSTRWRFDFISTIIYSVISIPLNFFFIHKFGIIGAALATLFSQVFYNVYRWVFLWKAFHLQPFTWRNAELFFISFVLIALFYFIPQIPDFSSIKLLNLALDIALRSSFFFALLTFIIIKRGYSEEVNNIWLKWSAKLIKR